MENLLESTQSGARGDLNGHNKDYCGNIYKFGWGFHLPNQKAKG